MQALRNARTLARLVLAWFCLTLGIAMAASVVDGGSLQLVCSSTGGVKLLSQAGTDDGKAGGNAADSSHQLHCPLCATVAPPPVVHVYQPPQALAHAVQSIPAARIAALTAAPLPARGPPALLSI